MRANKDCQNVACECNESYGYPSHFEEFHWWNYPNKLTLAASADIRISEPQTQYPYRYSSAGPCSIGRTQKELDIYRCFLDAKPKVKRSEVYDIKDVVQVDGYETTSMTASLVPYRSKRTITEFKSTKIPTGLNEPLYVPYKGHSHFDQFVIDSLYPSCKNDPLYKRRVIFRMDFFKPPLT